MAFVLILCLLLAVGSSAAIAPPSSQCAYMYYYLGIKEVPLLPSLVPSVSSSCLARYNATNPGAYCTAECKSLYSTYSQCTSPAFADNYASGTCGQPSANSSCKDLLQQDSTLYSNLQIQCNNATYCSQSCVSAIAALEQFSGCCRSADLNGPKALCGQPTVAPCSTVLNNGSVTAPSRECAYIRKYVGLRGFSEDPSLTPSLNAACRSTLAKEGLGSNTCISECQSLYTLIGTCFDALIGNFYSSLYCGVFNNQTCSTLSTNSTILGPVFSLCSNSTYCSPDCVNAITNAEQYGGCCLSFLLNGPKVLCGQQPISDCSTIVNGGGNPTPTVTQLIMPTTVQQTTPTTIVKGGGNPTPTTTTTPHSGCSAASCLSALLFAFAISAQVLLRY